MKQFSPCHFISKGPGWLLLLLLLTAPLPADAQTDWMKMGKDLLKSSQSDATVTATAELSQAELIDGLKEALRVGSARVVDQLGTVGGFNQDPEIHIPLPDQLQRVRSALQPVGMAGLLDDLEVKLNRAAEQATPPAKQLFWTAIEEMTLDDARQIYNGPPDAATRYFQGKMSEPLSQEMQPIIDESLAEVGAVQLYQQAIGEYQQLPFVPDVQADLTQHVTERAMDGIFHYLAVEEAAIRKDPAKRTTALLQKLFGGQ